MNCTALLLLLVLLGTAWSSPVPEPVQHGDCYKANYFTHPFKHVSDLRNSSVARWKLNVRTIENIHPIVTVQYAECIECTEADMIIKPIIFQVSIYKQHNHTWWMCPYDLEVGCTCVKKE